MVCLQAKTNSEKGCFMSPWRAVAVLGGSPQRETVLGGDLERLLEESARMFDRIMGHNGGKSEMVAES